MPNYRPYLTDDGSIGLFSGDYNDIFHSRYGALTEAYEKFIQPVEIEKLLDNKKELNVLDICYGIGYNTKALLNEIIKNISEKILSSEKTDIGSIHSDKKKNRLFISCNVSICTDKTQRGLLLKKPEKLLARFRKIFGIPNSNDIRDEILAQEQGDDCNTNLKTSSLEGVDDLLKIPRVNIDALEFEEEFVFLSPFIKNNSYNDIYKLNPVVSDLILYNLLKQYTSKLVKKVTSLPIIKNNSKFFNKSMLTELSKIKKSGFRGCKYTQNSSKYTLLHNIYYQNISKQPRIKKGLCENLFYRNVSKRYYDIIETIFENININFHTQDARKEILSLDKSYDIIFLDAFTPSKLPTLWTVDFFKELYNRLSPDGVIVTYTSSARVRSAMKENGFYIGTIISPEGHLIGTLASKTPEKIKHTLSDKEQGLINTKAGIPYRDVFLNGTAFDILERLECELRNSSKQSSSQYLKEFCNEI